MSAMGASMMQDLRYSLRQLRRSSGFAAIVVLTLSLGIGAATAVFSVIDAVLLRPLPFAHQERLVFPDTTARAGYTQPWSYPSYVDARAQLKTFEALAGYTDFLKINLEGPSGPVSLNSVRGTDNFFNVFGVKPILGRTYLPGEDEPGRDNVVVLSYEVWQTQFGAPAVRLSGTDPNRALRAGGGAGTGAGQHRLRSLFVVTQVALSLVLLVASGLLLRNLRGLLKTNLGFDAKSILTAAIDLSPGNYEGRDPLVTFYRPLLERVSHLPGVQGAGLIDILPVQNWGSNSDVHISGQPPYPPNQEMLAEERLVSAGYFDAMGIKLMHGRMLSQALETPDRPASAVVVNEAFRRKFFSAGGDLVGAHMDDHDKAELKTGIVGVVSDVRQDLQQPSLAEMDWLIDQIPVKERLGDLANMMLVVRSNGDLQALVPSLRNAFHEVDATVPFKTPETMTEVVSETLVFERMESWLFGIFAAFALLLAVVGLYGLINHEVELRTREIGIRMALGSTRGLVMRQVLRRVAMLMVVGAGIGWVLTLALKKVLASVVEMHASHDAALLAGVTAGLIAVGVLVSVAPARRAATIDPMQALRNE
jgi:predicted permease